MTTYSLLMIEDDATLAGIYAQYLEQEGYSVTFALNGEEGLRLAKKDLPELIILDLLLPKTNGFEVLEAMREVPELLNIPVIAFTNLGQKEDVERCVKLGIVKYLIKAHTTPQEMVNTVKTVFTERSST